MTHRRQECRLGAIGGLGSSARLRQLGDEALALGDVLDDGQQVVGLAAGVKQRHPQGPQHPAAMTGQLDPAIGGFGGDALEEGIQIPPPPILGNLRRQQISIGAGIRCHARRQAQQAPGHLVPQPITAKAALAAILDQQRHRDVVHHGLQKGARLVHFLFVPLARGDVDLDRDEVPDRAVVVEQRLDQHFQPVGLAVPVVIENLGADWLLVAQRFGHRAYGARVAAGALQQFARLAANAFVEGIAADARETGIDPLDPPARVGDHDAVVGFTHDQRQALQLLLIVNLLGHHAKQQDGLCKKIARFCQQRCRAFSEQGQHGDHLTIDPHRTQAATAQTGCEQCLSIAAARGHVVQAPQPQGTGAVGDFVEQDMAAHPLQHARIERMPLHA